MDKLDQAYANGWQAARQGLGAEDNPYAYRLEEGEYREWTRGWREFTYGEGA